MDAKQSDVVWSNHADLFQPRVAYVIDGLPSLVYITGRELEIISRQHNGYWGTSAGEAFHVSHKSGTIAKMRDNCAFTAKTFGELLEYYTT